MTAEIALMNKSAVALAADSAVTLGAGEKIYNTVNKLFTLSKFAPVGVMIYGSAEIMGVPWEVVIKTYRQRRLGNTRFDRLRGYAEHFIAYIQDSRDLFPEALQRKWAEVRIESHLLFLFQTIQRRVERHVFRKGPLEAEERRRIVREVLRGDAKKHTDLVLLPCLPTGFSDRVRSEYGGYIGKQISGIFGRLKLSRQQRAALLETCINVLCKNAFDHSMEPVGTGIVIAGFGEADFFPGVIDIGTDTIVFDTFRQFIRAEIQCATGLCP